MSGTKILGASNSRWSKRRGRYALLLQSLLVFPVALAACTANLAGPINGLPGPRATPSAEAMVDTATQLPSPTPQWPSPSPGTELDKARNVTVRTIAGGPNSAGVITGYVNGPGHSAQFRHPVGVCVGPSGDLFVADRKNYAIRKIDRSGVVSTFAGNSQAYVPIEGMGYDDDDGIGASAKFFALGPIAADSQGTIYVIDGSRIRTIDQGATVKTIAGSTTLTGQSDGPLQFATFVNLSGISVIRSGVVALTTSTRVRILDLGKGKVSTLAGGKLNAEGLDRGGFLDGTGTGAQFKFPSGMAVDSHGNLYTTDWNAMRQVTPNGVVSTVASPMGLPWACDENDNVYLASGSMVLRFDPDSKKMMIIAGSDTEGFADGDGASARFSSIGALCLGSDGKVYVADTGNHRIREITVGP